ncbi:MAG TPA: hypothetical protein VJ825_06855 [Gemmatimonadaceae bacterium]|nr:hypothetical protein [Gemmatimonadaceae bacterium]
MKTLGLTIALATTSVAAAGQSSLPPVRQLGPVTAVTKDSLGAISTVRQLSDGRVLVNDIIGRRVLLFDSTLTNETVVADTTSATANAYGTRPGGLIAYKGDSTLFIDPASLSMLLIDPAGKIARVMSAPRAQDVGFLIGGPFGTPGFDPQGRLVYRAPPDFRAMAGALRGGGGAPPSPPDSAAIVRFDLATRKLDTVTFFKTPKINLTITQAPNGGGVRVQSTINPMPQGDDWTLLPDGTIAIVRNRDFHVDWLDANGKMTSTGKIPFEWERLTDEQKVAFVDSAKTAIEKLRASGQLGFGGNQVVTRTTTEGGASGTAAPSPGPARTPGASAAPSAGAANTTTTVTAVGPGGAANIQLAPINMVSPSELPDYRPAFTPGSTRADAEGNLWIRTSQSVDGRPVYDVVNRSGDLVDRVQIPANRVVIGFGSGGTVYLAVRDGTVAHLEKAHVR